MCESSTEQSKQLRDVRVRRIFIGVLAIDLMLAGAKIALGRGGGLLAIEADGYHSLGDGLTALVALLGISLAMRPRSERRPYGHRKFEAVAAFLIGMSMLVLAFEVGHHVLEGSEHHHHEAHSDVGALLTLTVLSATLLIHLVVSVFQARAAARHGSSLLRSDARHKRADCLVSLGVLVTAASTLLGIPYVDLVAAGVIVVLIGRTGVLVVWENVGYLTDVALVDTQRVRSLLLAQPGIEGVHSIRTRGTPGEIFMDLKLAVPGRLRVEEATAIVNRLSRELRGEFNSVTEVSVQLEPVTVAGDDEVSGVRAA